MSLDCILTGKDGVLVIVWFFKYFFIKFIIFVHIRKLILKPVIISTLCDAKIEYLTTNTV